MTEWKDIDSSPKDGSEFLCWGPEDDDFFEGFGVCKIIDGDIYEGEEYREPQYYTHWMPLPESPNA